MIQRRQRHATPFEKAYRHLLALATVISISVTSCSRAWADLRLVKTEGRVHVSDKKDKSVEVKENLSLYSGYGVATRDASFGWISFDDDRLGKLDQSSEVEIRSKGKLLEVYVNSGSLYFDIARPLEDDEQLNIRTTTMLVGIRGTQGWVEADEETMSVYLLKGEVECTVEDTEASVTINAWEAAHLTTGGDISVTEFDEADVPDFVAVEAEIDNSDAFARSGLTDHVMDWRDAALETAMREITGISSGDIMLSDVWGLTELDIGNRGIVNISALGELTNLERLNLGGNQISDISALAGLTELQELNLGNNQITDASPIDGLPNMTNVLLYGNPCCTE